MAFTLSIGSAAPDFKLPGVDDKQYSLAGFKDAKVLVVVFACNHCPFVVGSEQRMKQLYADYTPRSVAMIAINSNETVNHPKDSMEHMKRLAKEKSLPWPYVQDESQKVALDYGALRTPHFYVFDSERKLRYTGRLDDSPRDATKAKTHELRDALDAVLGGKDVKIPMTNPIGCNVKWKGQDEHWMPAEACDLV